jgi:hypothetical protein
MELFREKFSKYIEVCASNTPIDDTIYELLEKQKNVIDVLYTEHRKYIANQFDVFIKKIEMLRDLEYNNLDNFRNFFKGKIEEVENKLTDLLDVKNNIDDFVSTRLSDLYSFAEFDSFTKEAIIKRVNDDMEVLKTKKQAIMNQFKDYQTYLKDIDKIKRYFQRATLNLKENKTFDLIRVLDKLYSQLEHKYMNIDLQEYLDSIVIELDEFALVNSRNNAPTYVKELLIACFKSKKVLSYNIPESMLSIIECEFKNVKLGQFLDFSRSINVNGILYINGGIEETKKTSKVHLSYDIKQNNLTQEQDMLNGHSAHSLIYVPPQYIYCISGSGTCKCERYDINDNTWMEIAELNYDRQNASLVYHNEQYLYVFGGLTWNEQRQEFVFLESVERLEIGFGPVDLDIKWEIVPTLKSQNNINISKSVMTVIPISSDKILLVGGMHKDQTYSDEVLLFDFEKFEFSQLDDLYLDKKTCFPSRYFLFFGDEAYQFDNEGDVHQFNARDLNFRIVTNTDCE